MRSTTFGIVVLTFLLSACGGEGNRTLENPNPLGIENPNLSGDKDSLRIILSAIVSDSGSLSYGLNAVLNDQVPNSSLKWSDLIGDRFLLRFGSNQPLQMQLYASSADAPAQFVLEATGSLSSSAFLSLHNSTVTVLNLDEQALGSPLPTPSALGNYPISFPPYSQRYLSNCAPVTNQPDVVTWQGFSSNPFRIFFLNPDGSTAKELLNLSDSSSWQLIPSVFQAYFSSSEIVELETFQAGIGYGIDSRDARMILVRSSATATITLATNPQRSLPVTIQTREEANYQIEYMGGCNP